MSVSVLKKKQQNCCAKEGKVHPNFFEWRRKKISAVRDPEISSLLKQRKKVSDMTPLPAHLINFFSDACIQDVVI